ncbi:MAG TPA: DinB family protein [Terriglobales bacterium]
MNAELAKLIDEAGVIAEDAQKTFGHLNAKQLNWKPSPAQWSVAQCLDHLIVINSTYFPVIEKIARDGYKPSVQQHLPLLPRFFGPLVLKAVSPEGKRNYKASSHVLPSSSTIDGDIVARFRAHQQELIRHMKMTENLDLSNTIITSPVASFATYSMLYAYRIVVAHERRHLLQAQRVMDAMGFPT